MIEVPLTALVHLSLENVPGLSFLMPSQVVFAITRPPHVQINDITVRSTSGLKLDNIAA